MMFGDFYTNCCVRTIMLDARQALGQSRAFATVERTWKAISCLAQVGVFNVGMEMRAGQLSRVCARGVRMFTKRFSRLDASSVLDSPCGSRPNCVCSQCPDSDRVHAIAPIRLTTDKPMEVIAAVITAMDRSTIVESSPSYIHALFRSRFGFVDDVELSLGEGVIHVRSASRLGYGDHGVNRQRVESIRVALGRYPQ